MTEIDRSKFRKEIIGPFSGQKFIIRRVRFKEFMTQVGGLPLQASTTVQAVIDQLKEKSQSGDGADTEDKITRFYASKGVIEPKIWFDAEADCPADCLYYADLGGDLDHVVSEVINFSHEMTGLKDMENFFRGAGAGAPGPDGQTIQPAAIEVVATGDAEV